MKAVLWRSAFIMSLLFLPACGSGSGSSASSAATGIRLLHGALDWAPFRVYSSAVPGALVQAARFAQPVLYGALKPGEQIVEISGAPQPAQPLFSYGLNVAKGERYSVLVYGGSGVYALGSELARDGVESLEPGQSALRLAHAALGAGALRLTDGAGTVVAAAPFGAFSEYGHLPAGNYRLSAERAVDNLQVGSLEVALGAQRAYTLLAGGETGYFVALALLED